MTRISKKLKNPELKALTKLVEAVCEFEGQIMWDINLNPYNPHQLGGFSYNDGGRKIELDELHNFIVTKYYRSLQYYDPLYINATADDYSVYISGTPSHGIEYKEQMGLHIHYTGGELPLN